jgi:hypothetical protein
MKGKYISGKIDLPVIVDAVNVNVNVNRFARLHWTRVLFLFWGVRCDGEQGLLSLSKKAINNM